MRRVAHQTHAIALEDTTAIEIDRTDLSDLLQRKPLAGLDMLTMVGRSSARQIWSACGRRATERGDRRAAVGRDRLADSVAQFGGSWTFIISFAPCSSSMPRQRRSGGAGVGPVPFILLNCSCRCLRPSRRPVIMMSQNRQDAKTCCAASSISR